MNSGHLKTLSLKILGCETAIPCEQTPTDSGEEETSDLTRLKEVPGATWHERVGYDWEQHNRQSREKY